LSTKKEGQGEREGSKATEDISDDDDKEENWDEDMDKVCTHVEVQLHHLPNHYCSGPVHVDNFRRIFLIFTLNNSQTVLL